MIINDTMLKVMQNFATIENSLVVAKGENTKTINSEKTIFANYHSDNPSDHWSTDFGIYDLTKFISAVLAMKQGSYPEIEFDEKFLVIKNSKSNLKYYYADVSVLNQPPADGQIKFPSEPELVMQLDKSTISEIMKLRSVLGVDHLVIEPGDTKDNIRLVVTNINNPSSNNYAIELSGEQILSRDCDDFKIIYDLQRWKLMDASQYTLYQSSKLISKVSADVIHVDGSNANVDYWIGQEFESKY